MPKIDPPLRIGGGIALGVPQCQFERLPDRSHATRWPLAKMRSAAEAAQPRPDDPERAVSGHAM